MMIDPKVYEELYEIDPKWINPEYEKWWDTPGDYSDSPEIFVPNTPEEVKQRYWAWEYVKYGYEPYDGYVFPYADRKDIGIISSNNIQNSLPEKNK